MDRYLKAAFAMHQDADSQTQSSTSGENPHPWLPNLLTGQKAPPADTKGSWKGLPAEITGSWQKRRATESVIPRNSGDSGLSGDYTPEIPECGSESRNPIIRCTSEELQHLISEAGVQRWDSKVLFQQRLEKIRLAYNTPLRAINVLDGLHKFTSELGAVRSLDTSTFKKTLMCMLDQNGHVDSVLDLDIVLQSMDFQKSDTLSVGEWGHGLAALFDGTQEEKENAIFNLLDLDDDHYLSYEDLMEYLKPFVKGMIPAEASVLQTCLLQHCTDKVLHSIKSTTCRVVAPSTVEKYGSNMVSYEELFQWLQKNTLGNFLAHIIDTEVGGDRLQSLIDDYSI